MPLCYFQRINYDTVESEVLGSMKKHACLQLTETIRSRFKRLCSTQSKQKWAWSRRLWHMCDFSGWKDKGKPSLLLFPELLLIVCFITSETCKNSCSPGGIPLVGAISPQCWSPGLPVLSTSDDFSCFLQFIYSPNKCLLSTLFGQEFSLGTQYAVMTQADTTFSPWNWRGTAHEDSFNGEIV